MSMLADSTGSGFSADCSRNRTSNGNPRGHGARHPVQLRRRVDTDNGSNTVRVERQVQPDPIPTSSTSPWARGIHSARKRAASGFFIARFSR